MDAVCNNTKGTYNCTCNPGYQGDGGQCQGKISMFFKTFKGENMFTLLLLKFTKTLLSRVSKYIKTALLF